MESNILSSQRPNEQEFNLKEWHLRARISRENTGSRRYSASYIRSFREDSSSRSFRSNFTISSTASSPGYHMKDEIDPSTYSFTTALKALQARSGYVWECLSPEGFALNSKWDEAERYICNPLSGEVPMECLSAKTLSGRSFRSYMASRVTMSAPLVYSTKPRRIMNPSKPVSMVATIEHLASIPQCQEDRQMGSRTRDVGTQSTPPLEESNSSPSPTSTPSIKERSIKRCEDIEDQEEDVQNSSFSSKLNPTLEECMMQVEVKITREKDETKRRPKEATHKNKKKKRRSRRTGQQFCDNCRQFKGCSLFSFFWTSLCVKSRMNQNHIPTSSE